MPWEEENCETELPPCHLPIFCALTADTVYFIQEDIDRLVRDLQAAEPGDRESVKSRHRKAYTEREYVRIYLPQIPRPTLTFEVWQFCGDMREWEHLEKLHQENARKDVRSARIDQ